MTVQPASPTTTDTDESLADFLFACIGAAGGFLFLSIHHNTGHPIATLAAIPFLVLLAASSLSLIRSALVELCS